MKKAGLRLTGRRKCYFYFLLFPFTQISKDCCQKSYNGFSGFLVISTANIFDLHILENETAALFFFFNLHGYAFWLFFRNERKMTASLLMIHLKCTLVHYTNLNWSSENKLFLNYGSLNMLFCFFQFLIYVYFNEAFVKIFIK